MYVERRARATFRVVTAPSSAVGSTISSDATVPSAFASFAACFIAVARHEGDVAEGEDGGDDPHHVLHLAVDAQPHVAALSSVFVRGGDASIPSAESAGSAGRVSWRTAASARALGGGGEAAAAARRGARPAERVLRRLSWRPAAWAHAPSPSTTACGRPARSWRRAHLHLEGLAAVGIVGAVGHQLVLLALVVGGRP